MERLLRICALPVPLLLAACVSMPSGPSVTSLPGSGKTFDQFRIDDLDCRQYATNAIGGTNPNEAQVDSAVKSGAVGAAVGGLAGAAIGGNRDGAGTGAGVGLLMGAMAGSAAATTSGYEAQRRYDSAYVQCMYAKGHQVPMSAPQRSVGPGYHYPPAAPGAYYPPPPPSYGAAPPPPPPGASAPPGTALAGSDRLFVYPRSGQSEAQTASDRAECSHWATNQTGYDAGRPNPADPRRGDYLRAIGACLEGRGYTVR